MSELSIGNLYDFNKQIMETAPIQEKIQMMQTVKNYFLSREHQYYMLLCHEKRNYTIFRLKNRFAAEKATEEFEVCVDNRGLLQSIDETEDKVALEIWIKDAEGSACYYLFPYDEGVIECGF